MKQRFSPLIAIGCLTISVVTAEDFVDHFESTSLPGRSAERGEWTFGDSGAFCRSDPELYRKFHDHGPILKWSRAFHDATIEFEIKPQRCQRVVFTLNGDGHIFRVTLADQSESANPGPSRVPNRMIAWAQKSSRQNKGDTIKPDGMPTLTDIAGQWTKVRLSINGTSASVALGDFQTKISHAALGRTKNIVTLSFAHGSMGVRNFRLRGTHNVREKMKSRVGGHQLSYIRQSPAGVPPKKGWPLLLFLHGYGECGDDLDLVRKHGPIRRATQFTELSNCIVVSPQCPKNSWWRVHALKALVDQVIADTNVDRNRIYITGLSMGGYGTWSLLSHYPDFFAAAVPICGGGDPFRLPGNAPDVKQGIVNEFQPDGLTRAARIPIWAFHGENDNAVPIAETERLVEALKNARPASTELKFSRLRNTGHVGAWQRAYSDAQLWSWMFAQQKATGLD